MSTFSHSVENSELAFCHLPPGFAPPAPVRCQDDPDMADDCSKFKEKKFCDTKPEVMEMICAETCGYCPKGKRGLIVFFYS